MSEPTSVPADPATTGPTSELAPDEETALAGGPTGSGTPGVPEDASKPTDEWVTGDEPMTGPQHSYLQTLAREAGREIPDNLTKAQASDLIDELQGATGRGA
jgi:Protein of unknown function (DUF3072)